MATLGWGDLHRLLDEEEQRRGCCNCLGDGPWDVKEGSSKGNTFSTTDWAIYRSKPPNVEYTIARSRLGDKPASSRSKIHAYGTIKRETVAELNEVVTSEGTTSSASGLVA
jgi:hypothetical protein